MRKISPAPCCAVTDRFMASPTFIWLPGRIGPAAPTGTISPSAKADEARSAHAVTPPAIAMNRRPLSIKSVLLGVLLFLASPSAPGVVMLGRRQLGDCKARYRRGQVRT